MKHSFLFSLINKFIEKRNREQNKFLEMNKKTIYLFLNSNPWFSAVTDYSLQICLYLKKNNKEIIYGAEKNSTAMYEKCKEHNIPFRKIPIHNTNILNFIISFFKIVSILSSKKIHAKYVFSFEGREHTILILTKILFPFLWYNKKLIRVRAQSQEVKRKFLSILVYKYYTDKIIFAANCVLNRMQFDLPKNKYIVQHYCKDIQFNENKVENYIFSQNMPVLSFQNLTFLVLGRFDAVKGHDLVLRSFLNSNLLQPSQLVFIGRSENIKAKDIYETYAKNMDICTEENNRYFLEKDGKKIYIVDEKFNDLYLFMQNTHFGIIPSLDSEVVCRVGVEFLQSGVPCLYSDAGALSEVFSDFSQLNFKTNDVFSLQRKIEEAEIIFNNKEKFNNLRLNAKKIGTEKYFLDNLENIFKACP
ncbi:MAG: glycosyltransferase [Bdellovibrionota bacterium]